MTEQRLTAESVSEVLDLLIDGAEPEPNERARLTSLGHGLQCAANLKESRPADVELQVAGLLHDVGHRLAPGHPELHGVMGANFVRGLFGKRVADLVELHVDAKRYLVAVEPDYRDQLSAGSAETLVAQGEALEPEEIEAFIGREHAADAIELRRADEAAKVPGRQVPGIDDWRAVLDGLVAANHASSASRP
jgi:predicted HD phosphohydrolase